MGNGHRIASLSTLWRERAAELRRLGADAQAKVIEVLAQELDDTIVADATEALTLEQAACESGLTIAHLKRLLTQGKLRSLSGSESEPLIERQHLPRKRPLVRGGMHEKNVSFRGQIARAIASEKR